MVQHQQHQVRQAQAYYLNTSYVLVQLQLSNYLNVAKSNLNTSYVLVQRMVKQNEMAEEAYLNTSYVLVQRIFLHKNRIRNIYLNTSYVLVQPRDKWIASKQALLFKYILCFGSTKMPLVHRWSKANLNTSYVLVQPIVVSFFIALYFDLNTSYVLVQQNIWPVKLI